MNKEFYDLLGLTEDATDEEIKERYTELKKKYNEDRWLDGEAGNEAARMLGKLDAAYTEIMAERREKSKTTDGPGIYQEIASLLKREQSRRGAGKAGRLQRTGGGMALSAGGGVLQEKLVEREPQAAGDRHADGSR